MRRTFVLLIATAALPMMLPAQGTSPARCTTEPNDWFNAAYKLARDSAALPGGKPVNVTAILAARTEKTRTCVAQFSVATTSGADLLALAAVYSSLAMDSLAALAVDKRLGDPALTEADRANALVSKIGTLTKPDTLVVARAEVYMAQLDAMSPAVTMQKLEGHSRLNGEYRYLDVDARIREHSRAIIHLTHDMKALPSTSREAGLRSFTVLSAYSDLAETYGDFGHADSALAILRQATADHPEISPADAESYLGTALERYALVGKPAIALQAGHWLNAPADTKTLAANNKVTVIEFTAHWCIPCRNSYPAMTSMAEQFGKQGVQFVFATQFYGYLGARKNLDPAAEFAADEEYFVAEHGIHFPIGVADQPVQRPGAPYVFNPNDVSYKVGGIPQTVIIDKSGTIRRILTGWDTGNAQRLPLVISQLLNERTARAVP